MKFSTLARSFPYGFRIMYGMQIEGFNYIFTEADVGATDITAHGQDASLIIDDSAAVGSRVDRQKGIGVGFELSVELKRTSITKEMFKAPEKITRITSDFAYDETTVTVESTSGWLYAQDTLYVGSEAMQSAHIPSGTHFAALSRGHPNGIWKAYNHPAKSAVSTWVTNAPLYWRGREIKLWAIPVDPWGKCQSADILSDAALIYRGYIASEIEPRPDGWAFSCKSQDRLLEDALGVSVSATARWDLDPDPLIKVTDTAASFTVLFTSNTTGSYLNVTTETISPFSSYTKDTYHRASILRDSVISAWDSATSSKAYYGDAQWRQGEMTPGATSGQEIRWWLYVQVRGVDYVTSDTSAIAHDFSCQAHPPSNVGFGFKFMGGADIGTHGASGLQVDVLDLPDDTSSDYRWVCLGVMCTVNAAIQGIEVTPDSGEPSDIPDEGWARIEAAGVTVMYSYDDVSTTGDKTTVNFNKIQGPSINQLTQDVTKEEQDDFTVTFYHAAKGSYIDVMRKVLLSSGRGDNDGTYDTLPAEAGYDIRQVDTSSFDTVLDGGWLLFSGECILEDDRSFTDLFGGLLSLSECAIVPRSNDDGDEINLTAIRTSVSDTALYSVSLDDDDLAVTQKGRAPVRRLERKPPPNHIDVNFIIGQDEQKLVINDVVAQRLEGTVDESFDVMGVKKEDAKGVLAAWAKSRFLDRHGALCYEIDVAPWVDAEPGDSLYLSMTHYALWNKNTGAQGYSGLCRVLGKRLDLSSGVQTLTVFIQGTFKAIALCPSASVTAFTGTADTPTSVTVDVKYVPILKAFLASENPMRCEFYLASEDASGAALHISAVSDAGVLTVDSITGTVNVNDTGTAFITVPQTANSSTAQKLHAHGDDGSFYK